MRFFSLLLLFAAFTADASWFKCCATETAEQKNLKAQTYWIRCQTCQTNRVLKPRQVLASGNRRDATTSLFITEYSLSFCCPKCKSQLHGRHDVQAEPIQFVTPLPPMPKVAQKAESPKARTK